jgi:hypothetical protein
MPSFWFDPVVMKKYGFGIVRLDDRQIQAKVFSNKTIVAAKQSLVKVNLSKFVFQVIPFATTHKILVKVNPVEISSSKDKKTGEKATVYIIRLLPEEDHFDEQKKLDNSDNTATSETVCNLLQLLALT